MHVLPFIERKIQVKYYHEFFAVVVGESWIGWYKEVGLESMYMCCHTVTFHGHTKHTYNRHRTRLTAWHPRQMFTYNSQRTDFRTSLNNQWL